MTPKNTNRTERPSGIEQFNALQQERGASKVPQAAQPARCPGNICHVRQYHVGKVFNPGNEDLPKYIKAQHQYLVDAIAKDTHDEAYRALKALQKFYTAHGPADGSALASLPHVPRRCKKACGVKAWHEDKEYAIGAEDLPQIVKDNLRWLGNALRKCDFDSARSKQHFLQKFFATDGPADGSALASIPALPTMCSNSNCPVEAEHAAKGFGTRAKDLPLEVVERWNFVWELNDRGAAWKNTPEQRFLTSFGAAHEWHGRNAFYH